jgi:uncharacterized LabA/DUF88 family protein
MEEKVAIFIDGSNLYHSVKNNFGRHDLNFTEFANKLSAGRKLFRIYYYNVLQDPSQYRKATGQQRFLDACARRPIWRCVSAVQKALGVEKASM